MPDGFRPIADYAQGWIVSASIIARDITESKRYEQRLRHLADHAPTHRPAQSPSL